MRFVPLAMLFLAALPAGAAEPDAAQVERRLQSVNTLIQSSSAAKQIESSADPRALEHRSRAQALHRQAADALAKGDAAGASKLLDQAAREMVEGARLARPDQVTADKRRIDFDNRVESVEALLAAQERIASEKGAGADASRAAREIRDLADEAARQAAAGDLDRARVTIDRAYLTAKVSIESLRRGDTLVRSLHFADKKEEYEYEIDRNDTHQMLVKMLLDEKRASNPAIDSSVKPFLEAAGRLRSEADRKAASGDHANAVRLLEESTKELVRAIRMSGIYIPG
ncbi:MAG TPA: hypothetical protein VLW45_06200 [Pelomicrobium sp.]|nr:hypothetical protein [Pelomicrobium sp.]